MGKLTTKLASWLETRRLDGLLQRFGGIQTCPWCRQCAQSGPDWSIGAWERDAFLDVLTCGVCGGQSLWKFEMGMHYIGALRPPEASWPDASFYSVAEARLIRSTEAGRSTLSNANQVREGED